MQYKKRLGDRKDGRLLRSLSPMDKVAPFLMWTRAGATNIMPDEVDISALNTYIHEKRAQGLDNFGTLHVIVAAYVRTISQRPGVNRFISGQCIYARYDVEVNLVVKQEMSLHGAESVISVLIPREATAEDVYHIVQKAVIEGRQEGNDFDGLTRFMNLIPRPVLRMAVAFLRFLDYRGWLPTALTRLSPFHGSMFMTSMSSLGIPPVIHHLYDFGNVPAFLSFGKNERRYELAADGSVKEVRFMRYIVSMDDRICDGFYYASACRLFKGLMKNPWQLDKPPREVVEDVD